MEQYCKAIGQLVRDIRNKKGYSTADMAEKMGMAAGTYRNLEAGQRIPTIEQFEKLGVIHNLNWFDDIVIKAMENTDCDNMTKSEVLAMHDVIKLLSEKYEAEKEKRKKMIDNSIFNLIMTIEREHSPNNFLNNEDIIDLGNMILNLTETRIKQLYDKVGQ